MAKRDQENARRREKTGRGGEKGQKGKAAKVSLIGEGPPQG